MVTIDTNIAFYALAESGPKAMRGKEILLSANFLSVQVLSEYAFAARRKLRRDWTAIGHDIELLRSAVSPILPIDVSANREALRIAERYQLSFFDAQMIAVSLAGGATILYSEDMQDGVVIDERLTIRNPFRAQPTA